jgi:hypothetical protein
MPGGIPRTGIYNEAGVAILSRDDRFNHLWISSRGVYFYDNETCEDIAKCATVPGEPSNPSARPEFGPNRITVRQSFPILPW